MYFIYVMRFMLKIFKAQELVNIQDHPFLPLVFVKVENMVVLERIEKKIIRGSKRMSLMLSCMDGDVIFP